MTTPAESVVLCEGVHDRAFWKGWLEHMGCRDARPPLPAGWYSAHNCDDFYQAVWRDPDVVVQLEARLRTAGAWRIGRVLAT